MNIITISEYKGNGNFAQNVIELKVFSLFSQGILHVSHESHLQAIEA